jgi:hypothetical protein
MAPLAPVIAISILFGMWVLSGFPDVDTRQKTSQRNPKMDEKMKFKHYPVYL